MREDRVCNIKLCKLVEQYPCLYDHTHENYNIRTIYEETWKTIAEQLGERPRDCRERWRNIRGVYLKCRKRQWEQSRVGGPNVQKEYYLAIYLGFLDKFIKQNKNEEDAVHSISDADNDYSNDSGPGPHKLDPKKQPQTNRNSFKRERSPSPNLSNEEAIDIPKDEHTEETNLSNEEAFNMRESRAFRIKLCKLVEQSPWLYDRTHIDYNNRRIHEETWTKIGEQLGSKPQECRERWRNIRLVYLDRRKRQWKQSRVGGPKVQEYYLAIYLGFLDKIIKPNKNEEDADYSISDADNDHSNDSGPGSHSFKRKRSPSPTFSNEKAIDIIKVEHTEETNTSHNSESAHTFRKRSPSPTVSNMDEVFRIKLCKLVEQYPCLYDRTDINYNFRRIHHETWITIGEQLGHKPHECRERWRNIRGLYLARRKRQWKQSRVGGPKVQEYYLAKYLGFLDEFINPNINEEDAVYSTTDADNENSNQCKPGPHKKKRKHSNGNGFKRKRSPSRTLSNEKAVGRIKDKPKEEPITCHNREPALSDMTFLQSVLPKMKSMDARTKRRFKIEILQLAIRLLDSDVGYEHCESSNIINDRFPISNSNHIKELQHFINKI